MEVAAFEKNFPFSFLDKSDDDDDDDWCSDDWKLFRPTVGTETVMILHTP